MPSFLVQAVGWFFGKNMYVEMKERIFFPYLFVRVYLGYGQCMVEKLI